MDAIALFKRGFAIGQSDIRGDCLHFRYENEYFVVYARGLKTRKIGSFIVAPVREVRKAAHG